jgi:hypothetical protein
MKCVKCGKPGYLLLRGESYCWSCYDAHPDVTRKAPEERCDNGLTFHDEPEVPSLTERWMRAMIEAVEKIGNFPQRGAIIFIPSDEERRK